MTNVTMREAEMLSLTAGEADPAFRRRAAWALSRLGLGPDQRLLEVGSGLGSLPILARRLAPVSTVAVDLDLGRLLAARSAGYLGASVLADAGALPLRAGSFDRALACEVLEHLEDDRAALVELRRVVRAGGRVAITVPHANYPPSWDPLAWCLERLGVQPPRRGLYVGIWFGHRRLYDEAGLNRVAAEAGWRIVDSARLTRGAFPFAHFLLYGVGKRLLDAGLVRGRAATAVGRRAEAATLPPAWHPLGLAIRVFRWFDARAERRPDRGRSVHLAVALEPAVPTGEVARAADGAASAPSAR